ncbi:hypothetical protein OG809_15725 [Kribbella soli]
MSTRRAATEALRIAYQLSGTPIFDAREEFEPDRPEVLPSAMMAR